MVAAVANVQDASGVNCDTDGAIEKRGSAVAIQRGGRGTTGNGGHYAKGGNHVDTIVARVCNKEVAIGCKGKVAWSIKSSAHKSGHCAVGKNEPDEVVA